MNSTLLKKDVIERVSEKLINEKIEIGGNGKKYKRKYHLKYTQKIITNVIEAFWEVVAEAIEDGHSIKMNGCIKMEPRYCKGYKLNMKGFSEKEGISPPRYKVKFTMGARLKRACKELFEKNCDFSSSER